MRNHRLFGVVTAVLLGTTFFHLGPSAPQDHHHHRTTTHLGGSVVQLASLSVPPSLARSSLAQGDGVHIGLLRPAGTRYLNMVFAWTAYQKAHAPAPPAPPVTPTPATPPAPHLAVTPVAPPSPRATPTPLAPATRAASGGVWAGLRQCESGGNYAEDSGNGYYGAYQFSLATWHGLGLPGLPSNALPAVQDRAAAQLQARSGWGQWPSCSRRLRLI